VSVAALIGPPTTGSAPGGVRLDTGVPGNDEPEAMAAACRAEACSAEVWQVQVAIRASSEKGRGESALSVVEEALEVKA
jgi:hypothetical protein